MQYKGSRDPRFVAVHRGGLLDHETHQLIARWAADCAEHVLPIFASKYPEDERPRDAIKTARAWSRGNASVGEARKAAFAAHAAARAAKDPAAREAAHAAGHAVATAHMADHELSAAAYAIKAVQLASSADKNIVAGKNEYCWQQQQLPETIRELVLSDQHERNSKFGSIFMIDSTPDTAFIACGALAREVIAIRDKHGWQADVWGVPSLLHNTPHHIPPAVQERIAELRETYEHLIVVYGDCGTAGTLDAMLAEEGVERVAGAHCYEMYADGTFEGMMAEAPGTYFLTDYLVQSFDHLVIEGMGLDRHPELHSDYFRHYTRVVYLAQRDDPDLLEKAQWAADYLKLPLEVRTAGYGALERRLLALFRKKEDSSADCLLALMAER